MRIDLLTDKTGSVIPMGNHRAIFTANLKRCAARRDVKQKDIAVALGIPRATVSDWFAGKRYPRVEAMERLADFLGVSFAALVCGDAPERRDAHTPNDHTRKERIMVTLSELLDITEVDHYTIYFSTGEAQTVRLEVPTDDGDGLDTVRKLFGNWPVKRISAVFRGDPRMEVAIRPPEPVRVDAPDGIP